MPSKSQLAIQLSKLKVFDKPLAKEEQYATDSEIAAEILWNAYMNNDIKDKVVADLGSGTGILGVGAILLGAKLVYFIEKDKNAVKICVQNLSTLKIPKAKSRIVNNSVNSFNEKVGIIVMNPPFGTKKEHADKLFLEKAFSIADVIYSIHKTSTKSFVSAIAKDHNFRVTRQYDFEMPLKATMKFHKKRIRRISISCFRLEKQ